MARTAIVVALVMCVLSAAQAQPLADRVPQDVVFYVGWRGSSNFGPAYEASHLKAVLEASNLRKVFSEFLPALSQRVAKDEPEAGQALQRVTQIVTTLCRYPTAFMFNDVTEQGMPRVVLICQAGEEAQALHAQLQALLTEAEDVPVPVHVFVEGDLAGLAIGYAQGELKLPGAGEAPLQSLDNSEGFRTTVERMQADPVVVYYADVQRVLALIDRAVQQNADENSAAQWAKVRDASGLSGIRRIIHAAGFEGKDWASHSFIGAPPPRKGIVALLDGSSLPDELLRSVPSNATFAAAGSFDLAKLVEQVRSVAGAIDAEAQAQIDKGLGAATLMIGRNVQKDILEPLGEHWLVYMAPTIGGSNPLGVVMVNQLRDPKRAEQGLSSLWVFGRNMAATAMKDEDVIVRGHEIKINDLLVRYVGVPLVAPSWAIKDGRLYVGLFPQVVSSAAEQERSGEKSILENDRFMKLRQRLGGDRKLTGFMYADLPATAPEGYLTTLALSRLLFGFAELHDVRAPEPVLPPLHVLLRHLTAAGAVSWVDETGWHRKSVTPFPGAALLSSQQALAAGSSGVALSVIVPSLTRARETAIRLQEQAHRAEQEMRDPDSTQQK